MDDVLGQIAEDVDLIRKSSVKKPVSSDTLFKGILTCLLRVIWFPMK